jgi:hypothetical protein
MKCFFFKKKTKKPKCVTKQPTSQHRPTEHFFFFVNSLYFWFSSWLRKNEWLHWIRKIIVLSIVLANCSPPFSGKLAVCLKCHIQNIPSRTVLVILPLCQSLFVIVTKHLREGLILDLDFRGSCPQSLGSTASAPVCVMPFTPALCGQIILQILMDLHKIIKFRK